MSDRIDGPPLREITEEEWRQYEWHEITRFGDRERIYMRGRRLTSPPEDGYVYVEVLDPAASAAAAVQRWQRAKTRSPR